jgi:hypothetical protein
VSGASTYNVRVCNDSACTSVIRSQSGLTASAWMVTPELTEGAVVWWQAQAVNACDACSGGNCQDCDPCEGMVSNVREMPPAEAREMTVESRSPGFGLGQGVVSLPPCGCQPQAGSVLMRPVEAGGLQSEQVPLPVEEPRFPQRAPEVEELPPLQPGTANSTSRAGLVSLLPTVDSRAVRSVLTERPVAADDRTVVPLPP